LTPPNSRTRSCPSDPATAAEGPPPRVPTRRRVPNPRYPRSPHPGYYTRHSGTTKSPSSSIGLFRSLIMLLTGKLIELGKFPEINVFHVYASRDLIPYRDQSLWFHGHPTLFFRLARGVIQALPPEKYLQVDYPVVLRIVSDLKFRDEHLLIPVGNL